MAKHKFENSFNPLDEIKDKILKRDIPGARFLEVERIKIDPQVRKTFSEESIKELADSIKEVGLISPLTVKKIDGEENFLLIAGERRLRALKLLGETKAQVIVREIDDAQIELVQIIENLHREDVPPLELAEGYKMLQNKYELSLRDIAKKIGKSHEHVNQMLKLLELPDYIKKDISLSSGLTPSKALEISKLDKKTQKEVLKNPDNFSREDIRKLKKGENQEPRETENDNTEFEAPDTEYGQTQKPEDQEPAEDGETEETAEDQEPKTFEVESGSEEPTAEDEEPEEPIQKEPKTEDEEPFSNEEDQEPEDQKPDIESLIEEFNLKTQNTDNDKEIQLIENTQREDLNPLDLSNAFKDLRDSGKTLDEIASLAGRTKQHVIEMLSLLELPDEDKEKIKNGEPYTKFTRLKSQKKEEIINNNDDLNEKNMTENKVNSVYLPDSNTLNQKDEQNQDVNDENITESNTGNFSSAELRFLEEPKTEDQESAEKPITNTEDHEPEFPAPVQKTKDQEPTAKPDLKSYQVDPEKVLTPETDYPVYSGMPVETPDEDEAPVAVSPESFVDEEGNMIDLQNRPVYETEEGYAVIIEPKDVKELIEKFNEGNYGFKLQLGEKDSLILTDINGAKNIYNVINCLVNNVKDYINV